MRLDAAIADATARLSLNSESPRLDAEILLCRTIDMPRSYLFAHPEDELDDLTLGRFEEVLAKREAGMPMAYIMGVREFWAREFAVSPATLVPRPETELLVSLALREIPRDEKWHVLDLGTGSGAIAVSLACERPLSHVTAVDVSEAALAVARENANALAPGNVECLQGSWTEPVKDQMFDLVVSNPPYVRADDEALARLQHEPQSALVAGPSTRYACWRQTASASCAPAACCSSSTASTRPMRLPSCSSLTAGPTFSAIMTWPGYRA